MSNVFGKPINRVDGRLKVTGGAKYSADISSSRLVHGIYVGSTIANGRIVRIDTTRAEHAPGVLAVLTHLNMPRLAQQPTFAALGGPATSFAPLQGPVIHYNNQPIAIVIADTLDRATHAGTLIRVQYQQEPAIGSLHDPHAHVYHPAKLATGGPSSGQRGNVEQALAQAPIHLDATYTLSNNHHNPLEPYATTAVWLGNRVTVYDSTQGVVPTRRETAKALGLPLENVRVITRFLGGGFGCKSGWFPLTAFAAIAARVVGRPVRLVLTRQQMFSSVGYRAARETHMTLGADNDGRLSALRHLDTSQTSPFDDFSVSSGAVTANMYAYPNFAVNYDLVATNTVTPLFMRGPGEAEGLYALESAMDELAYKLGIDPLELRMRNYAERDLASDLRFSSKSLRQCYERGAQLMGWSERNPTPRSMRDGQYLLGYGMASAAYPVFPMSSSAHAQISADGNAVIQSASQDIGTGTYTVLTQIAADALGLPIERVRVELGNTDYPPAEQSAGQKTASSVGSAVSVTCTNLRHQIITLALQDRRSPLYKAQIGDVAVENGRLFLKKNPTQGETYEALLRRQQRRQVSTDGHWETDPTILQRFSGHSFGAQFAQVRVDPDLGLVRVKRLAGVFASGRIINPKTARSQMIGGMIGGMGQALLEQTQIDATYVRYTNADLGEYLIPVHADIPPIDVEFIEEQDPNLNVLGTKGVGEIAIVGMAAAIANAVYHATGKRVRDLPITLEKLL